MLGSGMASSRIAPIGPRNSALTTYTFMDWVDAARQNGTIPLERQRGPAFRLHLARSQFGPAFRVDQQQFSQFRSQGRVLRFLASLPS